MKIAVITNEILIPKKIFRAKTDKDLEFDALLPEHCPDIARIIKIDCTPFAENCEVSDGKATVKGKAVYDLLYETDYKNRLRCCSFTQEFTHSVPLPRSSASDISAFCKVICLRISCKLLSPRRAMMKASLGAEFDIEGDTTLKAIAAEEDEDTFFRKKAVSCRGRNTLLSENFNFSESLSLAQSEKCIGDIVCGNISVLSPQVSISSGRAEIKASASVRTLCEEENNDGKYFASAKTLPINIEYNNDAIEENKSISVTLEPTEIEFTPELDQYGESRVIKANFTLKMNLQIREQKNFTVAEDMFERQYDSLPIMVEAALPQWEHLPESGFSSETKLDPLTPKVEAILDSSAKDYGASAERTDDGIKISGAFVVTLLADTAEGIHSFDTSLPYEQVFFADVPVEGAEITSEVTPAEVISTLHSDGSITLRVIATAEIGIHTETKERFISELSKRTPRHNDDADNVLIYCYPKKDESLWSIAKQYRIAPEKIATCNGTRFDETGALADYDKPILIKQ